jgi:hypothetical protein
MYAECFRPVQILPESFVMLLCPSEPHVSARLPLYIFPCIFNIEFFYANLSKNQNADTIGKNYKKIYVKTLVRFVVIADIKSHWKFSLHLNGIILLR